MNSKNTDGLFEFYKGLVQEDPVYLGDEPTLIINVTQRIDLPGWVLVLVSVYGNPMLVPKQISLSEPDINDGQVKDPYKLLVVLRELIKHPELATQDVILPLTDTFALVSVPVLSEAQRSQRGLHPDE